ncbi:MAG: hypothetical protein FJW61_09995 [Actinobacteria bacterium]|nr:hypothetical protein [Actinomycetota bacterium]
MIDGKFILEVTNYFILSLILIFGIVSLVAVEQSRKLIFLFLTYLSAGIASFLFFAFTTFALTAIFILFFFLLLFTLVFKQEFFGFGKNHFSDKIMKRNLTVRPQSNIIVNLILSAASCLFIGYVFHSYTRGFFKSIVPVKELTTPLFPSILADIGTNYLPVILLVVFMLASSFIWFIAILPHRKGKN